MALCSVRSAIKLYFMAEFYLSRKREPHFLDSSNLQAPSATFPGPFLRLVTQGGSHATGSETPAMMTTVVLKKKLVELRAGLRDCLKQIREGHSDKGRECARAKLATVTKACTLQFVLGLSPGCVLPTVSKVG